jgi:glycosyltransferase involved in cell wall biosynthesis
VPGAGSQTISFLTPLPPAKTGIAHYASMLLPALRQRIDIEAYDAPAPGTRHPGPRIYALGNNPHHAWIYEEAMRTPGVIVLHDLVLHHLIVEMTLAQGDADGYAAALRASHGEAGEAWARGRAAGLHSEMGNFLLPASVEVARRSYAVIVHNRWAADRLRSFGVTTPIFVVPHPFEPQPGAHGRRAELRRQHGFGDDDRVVGLFGFLTSAKRAEVVLAAFAEARARDSHLRLLVVGEPAPNIDVKAFQAEGITFTGYVDDAEFAAYFAAVDRLVNLRYPSAGETSGTLIRAFEAGKPVAVSDYAQFAELPDDCVVKIAFGDAEVATLARFFTDDLADPAAAQRRWLDEHARMELTVAGYLAALAEGQTAKGKGAGMSLLSPFPFALPIFPNLALTKVHPAPLTLELQNLGDTTLATRVHGQPGYRLIVKLFDAGTEIFDRWVELPRDLAPGERTTITLPVRGNGTLALYHALEGIPMLEPEAFALAEI